MSHFPGIILDDLRLDAAVRKMAEVCSLTAGREDAWARVMKTQVGDDGMMRSRVATGSLLLSQHCHS